MASEHTSGHPSQRRHLSEVSDVGRKNPWHAAHVSTHDRLTGARQPEPSGDSFGPVDSRISVELPLTPQSASEETQHSSVIGSEISTHRSEALSSSHWSHPERASGTVASLDKYAQIYVPTWLKRVNQDDNYSFVPWLDAEGLDRLDYSHYWQDVWPRTLWDKLHANPSPLEREVPKVGNVSTGRFPLDDVSSRAPPKHNTSVAAQRQLAPEGECSESMTPAENYSGIALGQQSMDTNPTELGRSIPTTLYRDPHFAPLEPHCYADHWQHLVMLESECRRSELMDSTMYAQKLRPYLDKGAGRTFVPAWSHNGLYTLRVPGIREEKPRLVAGHQLQLRPLASPSLAHYQDQESAWLHLVLEARIDAVLAVQGDIVLSCPALQMLQAFFARVDTIAFNVEFVFDNALPTEQVAALARISERLNQEVTSASWMTSTLFPSRATAPGSPRHNSDSKTSDKLAWLDTTLNKEQKAAITAITSLTGSGIPFLLSGPPGTGKTKTCVEAILQLVREPTHRLLVVTPSNASADVMTLRLAAHMGPKRLLRLQSSARPPAEVPERLSMYCHLDTARNTYSLPPWTDLMQREVVVTASHDVPMLIRSRCASNIDVGDLQSFFLPPLFKSHHPASPVVQPHWTHLVVDEAGQACETDLAPALATVMPHPRASTSPVVVLAGDPYQLGPTVKSPAARLAGLDTSLLERLCLRPAYQYSLRKLRQRGRANVLSRQGQDAELFEGEVLHCGHLLRNYRARHPSLLHLPSTLFYSDSLVPSSLPTPGSLARLDWRRLPRHGIASGLPMLFVDCRTDDEWVDEGVSWSNAGEAREVVAICRSLIASFRAPEHELGPQDIAVISPFREQVWQIRLMLRKMGLGAVSVGPVEAFQGQEAAVVIISPVRSRSRFVERDRQQSVGVIREPKRLNVALTRAQELLVIVGNAKTLSTECEEWREVVAHAQRNRWIVPAAMDDVSGGSARHEQDTPIAGQRVSALESAEASGNGWWTKMLRDGGLLHKGSRYMQSALSNDLAPYNGDNTHLLAGRIATVALQEDEEAGGIS
ncbi:unnamed protein product [Jaminaea pallidilutea]